MKHVNRKSRRILNQQGLTLVEVMVAIAILLLAAEIISISVSFNARMNTKTKQIFNASEELGMKIQDEDLGMSGDMKMTVSGTEISNSKDGWLYSADIAGDGGTSVRAMWAKDSIMTDLFLISGAEAPDLSHKPEPNTLPGEFPNLYDRAEVGKIHEMKDYCTSDENENGESSLIFHNETAASMQQPSFAILDGAIEISVGGSYTAAGVTVLDTGNISLMGDHISLWLGAEIYHISGDIECQYSEKFAGKDSIPVHLYLVPESGHGQPALVFVEDKKMMVYSCVAEDGSAVEDAKRKSYEIPGGWYAIPAGIGEETGTNAKDLLKLTQDDWAKYSLNNPAGLLENGALDKAYARLILAGLIDNDYQIEEGSGE